MNGKKTKKNYSQQKSSVKTNKNISKKSIKAKNKPKKKPSSKLNKYELLFKNKLEILNTNIDYLQKISSDSDIEETQEIIKSIINDIILFLKLFPETRDVKLITAFNKAYKKIERVIKSINLKIKSIDLNNKENISSNNNHDNILLDKVMKDTSIYYRVKYSENNNLNVKLYTGIFSLIYHFKITPDGKQELLTNGGLSIEIENVNFYNDNDYKLIDTIINGNEQNKKLANNQSNIIYNIIMDINTNNSSAYTDKNNSDNDNIENTDKINKSDEMLFLDVAFPKNQMSILASPSKVGKSFMSIEIGSSEKIKHPLFIFVDDQDSPQLQRYKNKLGEKATIIDYNKFHEIGDKLHIEYKKTKNDKLFCEQFIQHSDFTKIQKTFLRLLFNNWYNNVSGNKSFEVCLIENIVKSVAEEIQIDFICIDSLSAIFGAPQRIKRAYIDGIIKIAKNQKASLLLIHHTTGDKTSMLNKSAISGSFDNEYLLSLEESSNNKNILKLTEIPRYSERKSFLIKQTFKDKHTCQYEIVKETPENYTDNNSSSDNKIKKNLKWKIEQILRNHNEKQMTLKELQIQLKKKYNLIPHEGSIENNLKNIEFISKTNNKWKIITINP